jgi:undecaprenyl-diphosphatase
MIEIIKQFDETILFYIYHHWHAFFLDYILSVTTSLGDGKFIWISLVYLLLWDKKTRKYGVLLCISLILSTYLGDGILKPLFKRERPYVDYPTITLLLKKPGGYSFPSGHTMAAFASATILYHYNNHYGILIFIFALVMGYSRIYFFFHYPLDVLVGAILGIVVSLFTIKFFSYIE